MNMFDKYKKILTITVLFSLTTSQINAFNFSIFSAKTTAPKSQLNKKIALAAIITGCSAIVTIVGYFLWVKNHKKKANSNNQPKSKNKVTNKEAKNKSGEAEKEENNKTKISDNFVDIDNESIINDNGEIGLDELAYIIPSIKTLLENEDISELGFLEAFFKIKNLELVKKIKDVKIDTYGLFKSLVNEIKPTIKKAKPTVGDIFKFFEVIIESKISGSDKCIDNFVREFKEKNYL